MKQVAQHVKTGAIVVAEVPAPAVRTGCVLVQVAVSVISAGTERSSVESRSESLIQRARKNPDLVLKVLDQVRQYGVGATVRRVQGKLESLAALGYSVAGTVIAVGDGVEGISPGDRVACGGAGYANHAEIVVVPKNLCARIPNGVSFEAAAYGTIGAIALQGVRQTEPRLGEIVGVIGLGLIGQLTVQMLKANGCVVIGFDPDPEAVRRAKGSGADAAVARDGDVQKVVLAQTGQRGLDAVIITAATPSDDPVRLAGELCRDRGRVVLVGDVGLRLPRTPYYMKELDFRLSRSYGPGRYDPSYEEHGKDYPVGYVRWTERRNMEEFLRLTSTGALRPESLTTHKFSVDDAPAAFSVIAAKKKSSVGRPFGVVLEYKPDTIAPRTKKAAITKSSGVKGDPLAIGFIGAGSFAQSMLLPHLQRAKGVRLVSVCTRDGLNAANVASVFGFSTSTTDAGSLLADHTIGTVFIASRHHLHFQQVMAALKAGKNIFVEKPLVMLPQELHELDRFLRSIPEKNRPMVMVGFNRRFAPLVREVAEFFEPVAGKLVFDYRISAGQAPLSHWTRDPAVGGGRVVGEVCHFIDLISALARSTPVRVYGEASGSASPEEDDSIIATVKLANGSVGTITYAAKGDPSLPKEHLQIFAPGRTAILDNFQSCTFVSGGSSKSRRSSTIEKGHAQEVAAFLEALRKGGPNPIPLEQSLAVTKATFLLEESIRLGVPKSL